MKHYSHQRKVSISKKTENTKTDSTHLFRVA